MSYDIIEVQKVRKLIKSINASCGVSIDMEGVIRHLENWQVELLIPKLSVQEYREISNQVASSGNKKTGLGALKGSTKKLADLQ